VRAWLVAVAAAACACGGSPASPTANPSPPPPSVAIVGLTATVEPLLTTPQPGLLYRVTYQVRETTGRTGATLLTQHFAFSNGAMADGNFNTAPNSAHVLPSATISIQSTYSVYPATVPADRIQFSVGYMDDGGVSGSSVAVGADIVRVGF